MKKILAFAFIFISVSAFCQHLKIGIVSGPSDELFEEVIIPSLAQMGVTLEVIKFTDYITPNMALENGDIDVNYFQHKPYLDEFKANHGIKDLVPIARLFIYPLALYSNKHKSIADIKNGMTIAIPNDPANEYRSLMILERNNLIKLKDNTNMKSTVRDIAQNPKKLKFIELDAAQLPRALSDADFSMINVNYVIASKIDPSSAILREKASVSQYVNILVAKDNRKHDPAILKLIEVMTSNEAKEFCEHRFEGIMVPVF